MFVVTKYYGNDKNEIVPVMPTCCPLHKGNEMCALGVKDWRIRQTGPGFAFCVMHCRTHQRCFTLYPPGYVPYGRQAIVDLDISGQPVGSERGPPFSGTYFQAALDGAEGKAWPKEELEGSQAPRFITQRRHLARGCHLLGISEYQENMAGTLNIAGLVIKQASHRLQNRTGYRLMATCITSVLKHLTPSLRCFLNIASCGYYAGIWPAIQWWDEAKGFWRRIPFSLLS